MENLKMDKSMVIRSPKDVILKGIVINVDKTKWSEIIAPEKLEKFSDPEKPLVRIKYEVEYQGNHLKGEDLIAFYEKPMSNSKLGLFLERYNVLDSGVEIKVIYDKDGFGKILLE